MDGVATAVVTGSCGLVGSEAVRFFLEKGFRVIGIDNNMRQRFFGKAGSTIPVREQLLKLESYTHLDDDISGKAIQRTFSLLGSSVDVVIHAAAQPSHDYAAKDPMLDFRVNAWGTLNLLEAVRNHCPEAVFIFVSTNKVYGDSPNEYSYTEEDTRMTPSYFWMDHADGFRVQMSVLRVEQCMHSLFGASKLAADILVQEYGRYFGLKTGCFRCGCITGPQHAGVELHGFLSYLMKCTVAGIPYTIYGYKGKQVRDNIHSYDLVNAFWYFYRNPGEAEVFNIGGGWGTDCSILEAISYCENLAGRKLDWKYEDTPRKGDHIWWVTDNGHFESYSRGWSRRYDLPRILKELYGAQTERSPA